MLFDLTLSVSDLSGRLCGVALRQSRLWRLILVLRDLERLLFLRLLVLNEEERGWDGVLKESFLLQDHGTLLLARGLVWTALSKVMLGVRILSLCWLLSSPSWFCWIWSVYCQVLTWRIAPGWTWLEVGLRFSLGFGLFCLRLGRLWKTSLSLRLDHWNFLYWWTKRNWLAWQISDAVRSLLDEVIGSWDSCSLDCGLILTHISSVRSDVGRTVLLILVDHNIWLSCLPWIVIFFAV